MKATGHIYGLEDPRTGEIRYVGMTVQPLAVRLGEHCTASKIKVKTHKNSWIKSLVQLNMRPTIISIQVLPIEDLSLAEVYWIAFFRAQGLPLTNATDGGEGASNGHEISVEGRRRISEAQKALRSRPVIELNSGKIYRSGREAERHLNLYANAVPRVLSGKQKQAAGYRFQLVQGE